ncbi:YhcB family protein [Litoribrevibacter albus]|uniref:Z-ring associated protein G n=1 Tax=Litoribrevibacter albus TaxID=1473156 RepID=A0AA37W8B7_9GAMM|nr:DUF1043 family protein [Litoribrevibacter albus]GLQ31286.1 membrane protein [Litoribrevibacter albus]
MESTSIDWLSYGLTFILGSALGALLTYWLQPANQKSRQLEKQLSETEQNQAEYQDKVTEHFAETAELFSELTSQYKKVYDHLSKSSQDLCNNDLISEQLKLGELKETQPPSTQPEDDHLDTEIDYEMPKDYAHSADKQQGGTLAEDFGLQKKRDTPIDN